MKIFKQQYKKKNIIDVLLQYSVYKYIFNILFSFYSYYIDLNTGYENVNNFFLKKKKHIS